MSLKGNNTKIENKKSIWNRIKKYLIQTWKLRRKDKKNIDRKCKENKIKSRHDKTLTSLSLVKHEKGNQSKANWLATTCKSSNHKIRSEMLTLSGNRYQLLLYLTTTTQILLLSIKVIELYSLIFV